MIISSNKLGIASSEIEESNTGRFTDAVRGLTTGVTTLGGASGTAGGAAAAAGLANGPHRGTFLVTLTGSCFTVFDSCISFSSSIINSGICLSNRSGSICFLLDGSGLKVFMVNDFKVFRSFTWFNWFQSDTMYILCLIRVYFSNDLIRVSEDFFHFI